VTEPASSCSAALAQWYADHPVVRRLWAIQELRGVRVIVALEPTHDGDEVYPAWLANGGQWAHELQSRIDEPVELEMLDARPTPELAAGGDGVVVAALPWRDASA
jgi:hypothetical protein